VYPFLTAALLFTVCVTTEVAQQKLNFIDQGQSDPRLKGYLTPEGIKVEIVAEGPTVQHVIDMTFDTDGNLLVLEAAQSKGEKPLGKYLKGQVKSLTLGPKGVYDQAKLVIESTDVFPFCVLAHDAAIYLTGQELVRKYTRSQSGGPFDKKTEIARVNIGTGLTPGNDGRLYLTAIGTKNATQGADSGLAIAPDVGSIFRCRPDGSQMHAFAFGLKDSQSGVAFDVGFHPFLIDGGKIGRILHVPEGTNVGKLPTLHKTSRGTPGGLLIYNDTRFPDPYRGMIYYATEAGHSVRGLQLEPSGATFEVTREFELLKSNNPAFTPRHLALGPDGDIYVGDGKQCRIYRLSWTGTKEHPALPLRPMDSWAKIIKLPDAELIKALAREDFSDRQYAQREIVRRGAKNRPALLKLLADDGQPLPARIAALGALQSFWNDEVQAAFVKALNDAQSDIRRLSADGLGLSATRGDATVHEALARELNATDLAVRRSVFLAIGKVGALGASDTLGNALKADDGKDVFLRDGLVWAIEHLGKAGVEELLALADSGVDSNRDKVVEVFLATRTKPAYDALPTMLRNMHLSPTQKAGLVRSYANYQVDPPISLEPLVDWLRKLPEPADAKKRAELVPVKIAGMEVLARGGAQYAKQLLALTERWLKDEDAGIRRALTDALREIRERK
jgi:glucose/arabinose dehydrogenase